MLSPVCHFNPITFLVLLILSFLLLFSLSTTSSESVFMPFSVKFYFLAFPKSMHLCLLSYIFIL